MKNHAHRLAKIEQVIRPAEPPCYVFGMMQYDDDGFPAALEIEKQRFAPLPGETEKQLVERGRALTGTANLILWRMVKPGPNGGLAPGFERFAK